MTSLPYLFVLIASTIMLSCINASEDYQIEALNAHNEYRSWHDADDLVMDDELNEAAKKCAEYWYSDKEDGYPYNCPHKGGAGESAHFFYLDQANKAIAQKATTGFYHEIVDYDFNKPGFDSETRSFTQLVWKESKQLGFGVARGNGHAYAVALYKPPGNVDNAYVENVLPKTNNQKAGHKIARSLKPSSATSRMQINLNTCNIVIIYSVAICYALLKLSQ